MLRVAELFAHTHFMANKCAVFSAPEVLFQAALQDGSHEGAWTDMWSLGAVLMYSLRGQLPWVRQASRVCVRTCQCACVRFVDGVSMILLRLFDQDCVLPSIREHLFGFLATASVSRRM